MNYTVTTRVEKWPEKASLKKQIKTRLLQLNIRGAEAMSYIK